MGLAVGAAAPTPPLRDIHGNAAPLSAWIGRGPVALIFYRGGWCPFCNVQLHELATSVNDFTRRGVQLVAISVDRPEAAARSAARWTIPFPVLADPDLAAHDAYRVTRLADAQEIARLRVHGHDLEAASGRTHHRMAVPTIFLIDASGVVRWVHADTEYRTRPSPAQLLEVADRLTLGAAGERDR